MWDFANEIREFHQDNYLPFVQDVFAALLHFPIESPVDASHRLVHVYYVVDWMGFPGYVGDSVVLKDDESPEVHSCSVQYTLVDGKRRYLVDLSTPQQEDF